LHESDVVLLVFTMVIFGGVGILWLAMSNRRAIREMEHRERLAMIQHGLMPAPEADPVRFEAVAEQAFEPAPRRTSDRWRSAGVMLVGLGFALMVLISISGEDPQVGIGVGGAFAVLGSTLMFNSRQIRNRENRYRMPQMQMRYPPPRPPGPPNS
jgi:hypothetical protein